MNTTHHGTEDNWSSMPFLVAHTVVTGILIAVTEVGNILTIIVVIKYKSLRKQNFLIIPSLAAADSLGGIGIALRLLTEYESIWCVNYLGGTLILMLLSFALFLSHAHILAMSLDRFLAIVFPLKYLMWITVKRTRVAIAGIWISGVAYAMTCLAWGWEDSEDINCGGFSTSPAYVNWSQFTMFVLIVLTVLVTYSRVFRVARHHARKIHASPMNSDKNNTGSAAQIEQRVKNEKNPNRGKAPRFITAAIGAYLVTWTAFFAIRTAAVIQPRLYLWGPWKIVEYIAMIFGFSNSAVNVFIYSCYLSEFKEAYERVLCCLLRSGGARSSAGQ